MTIDQASSSSRLKRAVCKPSATKVGVFDKADPVHGPSSRQSDGITNKDSELQEEPNRLAKRLEAKTIAKVSDENEGAR